MPPPHCLALFLVKVQWTSLGLLSWLNIAPPRQLHQFCLNVQLISVGWLLQVLYMAPPYDLAALFLNAQLIIVGPPE
jgi:hypothetical protein